MKFEALKRLLTRARRDDDQRDTKETPTPSHDEDHDQGDGDVLFALSITEGIRLLRMPMGTIPHEDNRLEIPVRFAILANELLHRGSYHSIRHGEIGRPHFSRLELTEVRLLGRDVSGIFRVPGNPETLGQLHKYYSGIRAEPIDGTAPATPTRQTAHPPPNGEGPSRVKYSIHDVANLLKRYVRAIDGGIVGNYTTYAALKTGMPPRPVDDDGINSGFTVRSISCTSDQIHQLSDCFVTILGHDWRRFNFICMVFGVLATLKQDGTDELRTVLPVNPQDNTMAGRSLSLRRLAAKASSRSLKHAKSRIERSRAAAQQGETMPPLRAENVTERMTARALGAIFAPMLLDDHLLQRGTSMNPVALQQSAKDCAWVVEVIIESWYEIVRAVRARCEAETDPAE